jgi:hypothetical protein
MEAMMKPLLFVSLLCLSVGANSGLAAKPLPQGKFVCHVITEEGTNGVYFVQAHELEDAQQAASEGMATTGTGVKRRVAEVVECLIDDDPEFESAVVNQLLQSLIR